MMRRLPITLKLRMQLKCRTLVLISRVKTASKQWIHTDAPARRLCETSRSMGNFGAVALTVMSPISPNAFDTSPQRMVVLQISTGFQAESCLLT